MPVQKEESLEELLAHAKEAAERVVEDCLRLSAPKGENYAKSKKQ
jgi:predicted RNase H-like HicB family nuclease